MASRNELAVYYHAEAEAHRNDEDFWQKGGGLTILAQALVLTSLWANHPQGATWHLTPLLKVTITFGEPGRGPDDAQIVLHEAGLLVKRWYLPPALDAAQFVSAVERFIRQAMKEA